MLEMVWHVAGVTGRQLFSLSFKKNYDKSESGVTKWRNTVFVQTSKMLRKCVVR